MRHLGIITALPAEAKALKKQPLPFKETIRLREDVSLYVSGIGPARARSAAEELLRNGATALLSWGSAVGLIPTLSPGDLVLPEAVVSADRTIYEVDLRWRRHLCGRLADRVDFSAGPLAETEEVLIYPSEKTSLAARTGAVAADMESAAVALIAGEANIPFMAVRAIVDPVDLKISERLLSALGPFGQVKPFVLVRVLGSHPLEAVVLLRLGKAFRQAQSTMARVVELTGLEWLFPPSIA